MGSSKNIWATTLLAFFISLCLHPTCGDTPTSAPAAPHQEPPHCYVCESDKDAKCTPLKPSGDAVPSKNCEDPNKLVNKWLGGSGLAKIGIGSMDFQKLMGISNPKAGEKAEGKVNISLIS